MEEFIDTIQKNINQSKLEEIESNRMRRNDVKSYRLRELMSIILNQYPEVEITDKCTKDGDVVFSVKMSDIGISFELFMEFKKELFSDFVANFIGELLVRENFGKFSKILRSVDVNEYQKIVNTFVHQQFGMEIVKDKFVFVFHISFLQAIMMETLRKVK